MLFKPGDKVKFLNDVGGGIITKLTKDQAYVMIDDGFDIPIPLAELVKISSELPTEKDDKPLFQKPEPKKELTTKNNVEPLPMDEDFMEEISTEKNVSLIPDSDFGTLNMLLGFTVEHSKKEGKVYHAFLINDCLYRALYTFSIIKEGNYQTLKAGMLEDETKIFLNSFKPAELSLIQSFHIESIFYKKTSYIPHEPLVYKLAVDTVKFSNAEHWQENDFFEEKAFIINITEMDLLAEIEKASQFHTATTNKDIKEIAKIKKIKVAAENEEVDLHIEHLADNYSSMEASEILDIQMSKFHISMEGAIRNQTRRIIFIHGVGNGKLKFEIRKAMDTVYAKYKYHDASFKEYGYGATMVILK
jgi:hypothetical protein